MPTEQDIEQIQTLYERLRQLRNLRRAHERGTVHLSINAQYSGPAEALAIPMSPDLLALVHQQIVLAIEEGEAKLREFGFTAEDRVATNKVQGWGLNHATTPPTLVIICTNGLEFSEPLEKHPALAEANLARGIIVDDGTAVQWSTDDGCHYKIAVPQPMGAP